MPPRKMDDGSDSDSKSKRAKFEKGSEDYIRRRERNNIAVRKSRERTRQKAKETKEQMSYLQSENQRLEQRVQILSKELSVLKDLFLAHAAAVSQNEAADNGSDMKPQIKIAKNSDHEYSVITMPERPQ
ncbi:hypothetical protein FSP39_020152 [Pinctada imbricata]|uniref:BZIP domain-containing protein n=2 Tax=Pinctada TaxID=50425 RepID=A0AA88XIZ8_PINIB|nr:C/EBP-gamma [Pinctada fucata]KAK3086555.1 hypothetical protein FSP39_020152 [Pinctada imbricata]